MTHLLILIVGEAGPKTSEHDPPKDSLVNRRLFWFFDTTIAACTAWRSNLGRRPGNATLSASSFDW
jgi:hypothetical protein